MIADHSSLFLILLFVLQLVTLVVLFVVGLRRPSAGAALPEPQLQMLLAADLPGRLVRMDARAETLDNHLRAELSHLRAEQQGTSTALRAEVLSSISTLGETLRTNLDGFRGDNTGSADRLRQAVEGQLNSLAQRLTAFTADTTRHHAETRDGLQTKLVELGSVQAAHQDKLREAVEKRLDVLNTTNAAKLEEMRVTVDEKLHSTLQTRLTESFGTIATQLAAVNEGLGQMTSMTTEIKGLGRIFSNVKTRGGVAEQMVQTLLDEVLAPGQYQKNVNVRPGTQEVVEFAVKLPGMGDEVWMPIDAKFPREDWERLESAYESSDPTLVEPARRRFDSAIRAQAKLICSKYINEPITTPYAIMFLPTESIYAEVLRTDGLQSYMHESCRVMVAGPTNLYALLTSFRLGFRMLNLQKKGDEVWKVLAATQSEFTKFGGLVEKMDKQVGTVQNTIRDLGVRTRAIDRTLRDVSAEAQLPAPTSGSFAGFDGMLPMVAAVEEED